MVNTYFVYLKTFAKIINKKKKKNEYKSFIGIRFTIKAIYKKINSELSCSAAYVTYKFDKLNISIRGLLVRAVRYRSGG